MNRRKGRENRVKTLAILMVLYVPGVRVFRPGFESAAAGKHFYVCRMRVKYVRKKMKKKRNSEGIESTGACTRRVRVYHCINTQRRECVYNTSCCKRIPLRDQMRRNAITVFSTCFRLRALVRAISRARSHVHKRCTENSSDF